MSQENNLTPLPMMALYGHQCKILSDASGNKVLGVHITRTDDVEYDTGVTLKSYLIANQKNIVDQAALIADMNLRIQDLALFMSERFGYEYGNHSAADAYIPLFEYTEKVESLGDPDLTNPDDTPSGG